jgi:hypothetical protein
MRLGLTSMNVCQLEAGVGHTLRRGGLNQNALLPPLMLSHGNGREMNGVDHVELASG